MRIKILLMAVVLTGLLFSLSASAAMTSPSCGVVPIQQLNYQTQTEVDKFDSSLGELVAATVTVEACGYANRVLTNEDPIPGGVDYLAVLTATMRSTIPGIGEEQFQIATSEGFHLNLGESHTIQIGSANSPECDTGSFTLTTPAELAPYIGNAGDKVQIPVRTNSNIQVEGSTEWSSQGSTFMGVEICIVYEYEVPLCINGTKTDACTGDGLPGWTIQLMNAAGTVIATDTTDENGDYSFCDLAPGSYTVSETPQAGWNPVGPTSIQVTIEDESAEGVDFANGQPVCISGFKFNDTTTEGLSGWTIQLKNAAGTVIGTDTTDGNGYYEFCDLVPGTYTVSEVTKSGWTAIGPTSIQVTLECEDSEDNIFRNRITSPPPCGPGCPWFIKNEFYMANCKELLVVGADKGLLANEMFQDVVVLNPESITIDPKYGTLTVEEDGSFVYNPIGATGIRNGVYVTFKYAANNGLCDAKYLGIAKIQVSCPHR